MNRRKFFGTLAKGVAVATVAPTVVASVFDSVQLSTFSGSVSSSMAFTGDKVNMWLADEVGKTAMPYPDMGFFIPQGNGKGQMLRFNKAGVLEVRDNHIIAMLKKSSYNASNR